MVLLLWASQAFFFFGTPFVCICPNEFLPLTKSLGRSLTIRLMIPLKLFCLFCYFVFLFVNASSSLLHFLSVSVCLSLSLSLFLGSGPNRGQSLVKCEDSPSLCMYVPLSQCHPGLKYCFYRTIWHNIT